MTQPTPEEMLEAAQRAASESSGQGYVGPAPKSFVDSLDTIGSDETSEFDVFGTMARRIGIAASGIGQRVEAASTGEPANPFEQNTWGQSEAGALGIPMQNPKAATAPRSFETAEASAFIAAQFRRYVADENYNIDYLLSDAKALGYAPDVIYALREEWMEVGTAENVMKTLSDSLPDLGKEHARVAEVDGVELFMKEFGDQFTSGELDFMLTVLAAMPENEYQSDSNLNNAGLALADYFHNMVTDPLHFATLGLSGLISGDKFTPQDFRSELSARAIEYLTNNPLDTDLARKNFTYWFYNEAQRITRFAGYEPVIDEETGQFTGEVTRGFFGDLGAAAAAPFRAWSDVAADHIAMAASPDQFSHRQFLSFGENIALASGLNPGDNEGHWLDTAINKAVTGIEYLTPGNTLGDVLDSSTPYQVVSGTFDFLANLSPMDPINLIAGAGQGAKAAKSIPRGIKSADGLRDISKGRAVLRSLRPFSGRSMDLPLFSRGITTRVTYSLLAKSADEMLQSSQVTRAAEKIAKINNAAELADAYPELKRAPDLVAALAQAEDVATVKGILRLGIQGQFSRDAGDMLDVFKGHKAKANTKYVAAWNEAVRKGEIGLGDVVDDFDDVSRHGVWDNIERLPANVTDTVLDEGVTAGIERNMKRLANQPELGRATLSDGREVIIKGFGNEYAAFLDDGTLVAGLSGSRGEIATMPDFRRLGAARALTDIASPEAIRRLETSTGVSRSAANLLDIKPQKVAGTPILVEGTAEGNGSRKMIFHGAAHDEIKIRQYGDAEQMKFAFWAGKAGRDPDAVTAAAKLAAGETVEALSEGELAQLRKWMDDVGLDGIRTKHQGPDFDVVEGVVQGPESLQGVDRRTRLVVSNRGERKMTSIVDSKAQPGPRTPKLLDERLEVARADSVLQSAKAGRKESWVFIDMPREPLRRGVMKNFGKFLSRRVSSRNKVGQFFRRTSASFKDSIPDNISLVDRRQGSSALAGWMRGMGASQEDVQKWVNRYQAASSPTMRRDIIFEAFKETGENIKDPFLKHEIMRWNEKAAGITGFEKGASGEELGRLANGSSVPISTSMQTRDFVMPQWSKVKGTLRRGRHAKYMPKFVLRGFGETAARRRQLIRRYQKSFGKSARNAVKDMNEDMLMRMAYSDVIGEGQGRVVGAFNTLVRKPYSFFHHTFSVLQLFGRPFAWAGRVLLEETVRANMTNMPSVWRHPLQYMNAFWDAHAWRALPKQVHKTGRQIDEALDFVFEATKPSRVLDNDVQKILTKKGYKQMLEDTGVDPTNLTRSSRAKVRSWMAGEFAKEMFGDGAGVHVRQLGNKSNTMRRVLRQTSGDKVRRFRKRLTKRGLPDNFTPDDVPDIINRTMFNQYITETERIHEMSFVPGAMSRADLEMYGEGYGRQLVQATQSYDGRATINLLLDELLGGSRFNAQEFIASKAWKELRPNAKRLADERRWVYGTEAELARVYLQETQAKWMDSLFGAWWTDPDGLIDPVKKEKILNGLAQGRLEIDSPAGKVSAILDQTDESKTFAAGRQLAEAADLNNIDLPTINAHLNPRFGQTAQKRNAWRRMTDWTLYNFGERVSQNLNRQPGFLHTYQRWFDKAKSMGWDDDAARIMAKEKAAETVNYVFFDNKGTSRFLKSMNKVVPFFSAWWEVFSTWFYKIPQQETLLLGYPHLIRRTDRFFDALVHMGIATPTEQGYTIELSPEPDTGTPIGDALSVFGHSVVRSPFTVIEAIANIGRTAIGEEPVDWAAYTKDDMTINIGNPTVPTDTGLMAVNQFGFGFSPMISGALGTKLPFFDEPLVAKIPGLVDEKKADYQEGESLFDFLGRNPDLDPDTFIAQNHDELEEALGKANFNKLLVGDLEPGAAVFKKGGDVTLSGTSLIGSWVEDTFFPFGQYHGVGGVIGALAPSWSSYVMRGIGVMLDDDPTDNGLIGAFLGPTSNYQIGSELIAAYQWLEANEGSISRVRDMTRQVGRLIERDTGQALSPEMLQGPEGLPEELGEDTVELLAKIERANENIVRRAQNIAGGSLIVRGMLGFFGPVTPRMHQEQQASAQAFWASRDVADVAASQGSEQFLQKFNQRILNEGVPDLEMTNALVSEWLEDPTGDKAKVWMRTNHPGVVPFIQGKTFWGPAGPPPQVRELDKFFEQIENGERQIYPPDVWYIRYMNTVTSLDKEIEIALRYGNDPAEQFLGWLHDGVGFREITEEYDRQYETVDYIDEVFNDSAYNNWRNRNATDQFVVLTEIERDIYESREFIDEMEAALNFLNLPANEIDSIVGKIGAGYREMLNRIDRYNTASENLRFKNPREQMISQYYTDVATPYYEQRNELFGLLPEVWDSEERSVVFDMLRQVDNEHALAQHTVRTYDYAKVKNQVVRDIVAGEDLRRVAGFLGVTPAEIEGMRDFNTELLEDAVTAGMGEEDSWGRAAEFYGFTVDLPVPSEIERKWMAKTEEEKEVERLETLNKKPEWMSFPEIAHIGEKYPEAFNVLPSTSSQSVLYDEAAKAKKSAFAAFRAGDLTEYEKNQIYSEVDDWLMQTLWEEGRTGEVLYAQAWPIQRLAMLGMLPVSLEPVLEQVNGAEAALEAADKTIGSGYGLEIQFWVNDWLRQFFAMNQQARDDFVEIGGIMFEETVPTRVAGKLLWDEFVPVE